MALTVWKPPVLDDAAALPTFKQKTEPQSFTIADHPNLAGGPVRALFDALRAQILALDPAVAEVFLKLYPWPFPGRPPKHDLSTWTVIDDWPDPVPVTDAEVAVFERWFGDLFDELFGTA
ncbi:MAG: hypothetical protein HC909_00660 [Blastochloris sp.]|nr:hypothetical protein [Blastochloris sp.]